jgi:hypothetical protein
LASRKPRDVRVGAGHEDLIAVEGVDMRKGFDGL